MIIKNLWSEVCEYPSLNKLKLLPGDIADLSKFSTKQLDNCKELQNDFVRGYCIIIGKNIKEILSTERNEVKIVAKPKSIPSRLSTIDKRSIYSKLDKSIKEKEARQYKQIFPKSEVIEEDPNQERLVVVDPNGQISVTSISTDNKQTVIDLEPFEEHIQTGEHYQLPKPKPKKDDFEVQEILERIKDKEFDAVPMCGGVNRMGRACNKRSVRGYKHCIRHMSDEERIDYKSK